MRWDVRLRAKWRLLLLWLKWRPKQFWADQKRERREWLQKREAAEYIRIGRRAQRRVLNQLQEEQWGRNRSEYFAVRDYLTDRPRRGWFGKDRSRTPFS